MECMNGTLLIIGVILGFLLFAATKQKNNGNQNINQPENVSYLFYKRFHVKNFEKALLIKANDFVKILTPGVYWYFDPFNQLSIKNYNLKYPEITDELMEIIRKNHPDVLKENFETLDLKDMEVGLVYFDNKLTEVVPPARKKYYWKGIIELKTEILDISNNYELPEDKKNIIIHLPKTYEMVEIQDVKDYESALLYIDNHFAKVLDPGIHAFWKFNRFIKVKHIDLRIQNVEVSGQEIITSDKLTLRINMSANYQITDGLNAISSLTDYKDYLYKELQFGIREIIGSSTLDELLTKKDEIQQKVFSILKDKCKEFGIELRDIGIKDIILPGDMRDLMNKVVEAQKQAEANIINRREETAATRSLLNTVKVMENNPTLLRLKELETLEKITGKINTLNVYGGLEGVLSELVKIKSNEKS